MLNKPNNGPHTPTHNDTAPHRIAQWAIKAQTENLLCIQNLKKVLWTRRLIDYWLANAITVTHLDLITNLEAFIFEHQLLESFSQLDMVTYVML